MSETSNKYTQQTFFNIDTSTYSQVSDVSPLDSCEPTTPSVLEPLQPDFLVKTLVRQDDKKALQEDKRAASGKKSSGSSKSAGKQESSLTTSLSKTSETSSQVETGKKRKRKNNKKQKHNTSILPFAQLIAGQWMKPQMSLFSPHGWASYSQSWPDVGMMRNGQCYPLPTLVPRTSEKESLLWRTPTKLESPNRKLPSPMGSAVRLSQQVFANGKIQRIWPTPAAQDSKNATLPPSQVERDTLPGAICPPPPGLWSPPQADENGSIKPPEERAGHNLSLSNQVQGSLNPSWVEMLMGLPIGWTDIDGQLDQENSSTTGSLQEPSEAKTA
jgi:hypothetical protein